MCNNSTIKGINPRASPVKQFRCAKLGQRPFNRASPGPYYFAVRQLTDGVLYPLLAPRLGNEKEYFFISLALRRQ